MRTSPPSSHRSAAALSRIAVVTGVCVVFAPGFAAAAGKDEKKADDLSFDELFAPPAPSEEAPPPTPPAPLGGSAQAKKPAPAQPGDPAPTPRSAEEDTPAPAEAPGSPSIEETGVPASHKGVDAERLGPPPQADTPAGDAEVEQASEKPMDEETAPSPPETETAAAARRDPPLFGGGVGVGVALRLDFTVLNGRTLGVKAAPTSVKNALTGEGIKGLGGGVLLQLAWHLPLENSPLDRVLGIELDAGYALSGTNGTVSFQQYETAGGQTRLVTSTYTYSGLLHSVPISLGLRGRLPLQLPVHIDVAAGGTGVWGFSSTTSSLDGAGTAFSEDNAASDFAWGYYLEAGVAFSLGVGELTAAYRYSSAFLDFEHPEFNPEAGDLGGHHVVVGYRFLF